VQLDLLPHCHAYRATRRLSFWEFDVIAQNSTAVYKGKQSDVREIAKALNVRYVLEGSIQRQGDHVRVTAQLMEALHICLEHGRAADSRLLRGCPQVGGPRGDAP
jgi:hypothetical protein